MDEDRGGIMIRTTTGPPDTGSAKPTNAAHRLLDRSVPLLRGALGVVFLWFGALKLAGASPVHDLVAATVPFVPGAWSVPLVGLFEVLLGAALVAGLCLGVVTTLTALHLLGTFLVLVAQPGAAFQDGNPLLLTVLGEFVAKNLVLVAAALVVAQRHHQRHHRRHRSG